jgi:hypothetical protein
MFEHKMAIIKSLKFSYLKKLLSLLLLLLILICCLFIINCVCVCVGGCLFLCHRCAYRVGRY